MRRFGYFLLALFLAFSISASAHAQSQVVLGNSAVELTGPWKFHTGDNPRWAEPNFDASTWDAMDLTPQQGSTDPYYGASGFVPGWTARGYAGYSGFAWYRLRINLQENVQEATEAADTGLALKMPGRADDAYQVYVNGQLAGQLGRFAAGRVTPYYSQPQAFAVPAGIRGGPVTIAIRMWMDSATPLSNVAAGGLHGPPVLGQAPVIRALLRLDWYARDRSQASGFLEIAILLLALLVAFGLYGLDRGEPAYLWLGLTCATLLLYHVVDLLGHDTTQIGATAGAFLLDVILIPAAIGLWVLFWGYWFRLGRMARLHRVVWGLVLLLAASMAMQRTPLYGGLVPAHAIAWLSPLTVVLNLLIAMLLIWVTYQGIRKNRTEGWLALPAVLLVAASLYRRELLALRVPVYFFPLGFRVDIRQIANVLSLVIITALLIRRFLRSEREREQWKLEMEQARQMQALLIPATLPSTPGFAVESVYLPASEVGGDFFQVQPGRDGSLLIVVGDVSGKGLQAAMTVSTIVGALRGCSSRAPAEVLAYLNRVLHGQVGGFVTCCATLITCDGKMTLANAGHLPPYRNGEELAVAGGLPLGILAEISYGETHYDLIAGDRLTFLSDGVVEARDAEGELYGFERTRQISGQPATTIAETARRFGQEDDISVLSVTRTPNAQAAIA